MGIVCESRINALTYPFWGLCLAVLNLHHSLCTGTPVRCPRCRMKTLPVNPDSFGVKLWLHALGSKKRSASRAERGRPAAVMLTNASIGSNLHSSDAATLAPIDAATRTRLLALLSTTRTSRIHTLAT